MLVILALLFPLVGAIVLPVCAARISRQTTGLIASAMVLLSFFCFIGLFMQHVGSNFNSHTLTLYQWVPVAGVDADFSLRIDSLSLLMGLIISGVGFLIHVYSIGYMDHDDDYVRYFACLNFFIFAMLILVLAANLLLLFVGWEGVGLASYLLIGFWYTKPEAAQAATKAFIVNRIGDAGLLIGLLLTLHLFGTSGIASITQKAPQQFAVGASLMTLLTSLYFVGAVGKSAQLPLHVWLPDAMAGPTPVSALIHAATMVTAGVYLIVRMHDLFMLAPMTMQLVGTIGAVTSLFAALCALGQTDLKRVLAYSTVSQLGLMFVACGAGAFYAAMFHLTTHAFVKALLFLAAGNVVHMLHGETDMNRMGGLRHSFPKTNLLFLVGVLAMSGIPPLSAFYSKDLILDQEHQTGHDFLFAIALATSALTAFYLMRAYCLTFLGEVSQRHPKGDRDAPTVMLGPVGVLAFCAIFGGVLGFTFNHIPLLESFLIGDGIHLALEDPDGFDINFTMILAVAVVLLGIALSALLYTRNVERRPRPLQIFLNGFYIDRIYEVMLVRPLSALASFVGWFLEGRIIQGSISMTSEGIQNVATALQRVQSGQIRSYIAWLVIGSLATLALIMGR